MSFAKAQTSSPQLFKNIDTQKLPVCIVLDTEYSEIINDWNQRAEINNRLGFKIKLSLNKTRQKLYFNTATEKIFLNDFIDELLPQINKSNKKYVFIVEIQDADISVLNSLVEEYVIKLNDTLTGYNASSLSSILKYEKITWFTSSSSKNFHKRVYYKDDYLVEQHLNTVRNTSVVSSKMVQGSLLYGLFGQSKRVDNTKNTDNENFFYGQGAFSTHWLNTGIQPVFIVVDNIVEEINSFQQIASFIKSAETCYGTVSSNGIPLNYLYWEHNNYKQTKGMYSFPIINDELTLKPYKPGYTFTPNNITVKHTNKSEQIDFEAQPMDIVEGLKEVFNVKNTDSLPNNNNKECTIIQDINRGNVLQINHSGCYHLNTTMAYQMVDHSFTISMWANLLPDQSQDVCLIGTKLHSFRKGLNIRIRDKKPYFGFSGEDLWSRTELTPEKWHHLVFSYDAFCCEKRTYIDGALTDISVESLSFLGEDTLTVGRALKKLTPSSFLIDDIAIWNRALNEKEVAKIYTGTTLSIHKNESRKPSLILILFIITILGGLTTLFFFLRKKNFKQPKFPEDNSLPVSAKQNAIYLFGDFTIYDNNGSNIANILTPQLKQIFLFLLLSGLKENNGVKSSELNKQFWEGLNTTQIRNNRNVALTKLRKAIENVKGLSIERVDSGYTVSISPMVYCDFLQLCPDGYFSKIPNDKNAILGLIKCGLFLQSEKWEWLEEYKYKINYEIRDLLIEFVEKPGLLEKEEVESVCLFLLEVDDLDEIALKYLIKHYVSLGKNKLAQTMFKKYTDSYKTVYNEAIEYSFQEFVES